MVSKRSLATLISRIFDPILLLPIAILLAISFAVAEGLRWRFLGLILFIDVVIPIVFFLIMLAKRQISSWDLEDKKERRPLYIFALICQLGGLWLAWSLQKYEFAYLLLVYYLIGIVFLITNYFYKISLHSGANAGLITLLNVFYDWKYWYLYIVLLLVMWARVVRRDHTMMQVVFGSVVGIVFTLVGLSLIEVS